MLQTKSLRMALVPSSLLPNPSPGNLQSTRLAFHVDDRAAVCSVSVASGCRIYKIEVVNLSLVDPCPHRSEIQSVVLAEEDDCGIQLQQVFVQSSLSMDESSILVVSEASQLSAWNLRTNSNGWCIHRVCGAVGDLIYAVCSWPSGPIAAGGSDRTVTIYDPRRWSALSRLVSCSKYEITGLSFSSLDKGYIYIRGVDYECANKDVLAGWRKSGSIFLGDVQEPDTL